MLQTVIGVLLSVLVFAAFVLRNLLPFRVLKRLKTGTSMLLEGKANTFFRLTGSPRFLYGTAWKKERSTALVKEALGAGFRAVDTACQPRHYQEGLVGDGLREAFKADICSRQDIFLQTKFTQLQGQDPNNIPYEQNAPLEEQVRQSVEVSLRNLRPTEDLGSVKDSYIDCLLLHSPIHPIQNTLHAWKTLESYVPDRIRSLGISNVSIEELQILVAESKIKPAVVQNRFYDRTRYDVPLRRFCCEHDIIFESFWTLTGNPRLLKSAPVTQLSKQVEVSVEEALYALVMAQDIAVLNGTTNLTRMKDDLASISAIDVWARSNEDQWTTINSEFQSLLS